MSLTPGLPFGSYEIVSQLGVGGPASVRGPKRDANYGEVSPKPSVRVRR